jgi:hypothetical protein
MVFSFGMTLDTALAAGAGTGFFSTAAAFFAVELAAALILIDRLLFLAVVCTF